MQRYSKLQILSGILAISLMVGCGSQLSSPNAVATINNHDIVSKTEFRQSYDQMLRMMHLSSDMFKNPQYKPMEQMFQKIAIQNLILTHLVREEAEKRHIAVSDSEIQDVYRKQVALNGGEKAFSDQLSKLGVSKEQFLSDIKDQLIKDKLVAMVGGQKITTNAKEAEAFYNSHQKDFNIPEQVHARHILIASDPKQIRSDITSLKKNLTPAQVNEQVDKTLSEKKQKAQTVYQEVMAHPDQFETLARKNSDDTASAEKGGDLGYFPKDAMVPAFSQAAFATKPGQVHEGIVETPFGFHIIQVLDRKVAQDKTFDEVKNQIMTYLEQQKKAQVMDSWLANAKQKAKIVLAPEFKFVEDTAANAQKATANATASSANAAAAPQKQ